MLATPYASALMACVVSNHGGRQFNGVLSSAHAYPAIAEMR
ncbi:alpha-hydroxy-acid oxidizing protein [Shigella flexneri]